MQSKCKYVLNSIKKPPKNRKATKQKSVSIAQSNIDANCIPVSEAFAQSEGLAVFTFLNRLNRLNNSHSAFNGGFIHGNHTMITLRNN